MLSADDMLRLSNVNANTHKQSQKQKNENRRTYHKHRTRWLSVVILQQNLFHLPVEKKIKKYISLNVVGMCRGMCRVFVEQVTEGGLSVFAT